MGSSASDLPTGDSVIADVRSRLSAGVKGLGARLGRSGGPAGVVAGDAPSEDGSSESGGGSGIAGGLPAAQHRSVADRLADKLSDVKRTLLDQPPRPTPAAQGEARYLPRPSRHPLTSPWRTLVLVPHVARLPTLMLRQNSSSITLL
jgi:hypothetical protein